MTLEREREGNRAPPRLPDFFRSTIFALSLCAISSLFLYLSLALPFAAAIRNRLYFASFIPSSSSSSSVLLFNIYLLPLMSSKSAAPSHSWFHRPYPFRFSQSIFALPVPLLSTEKHAVNFRLNCAYFCSPVLLCHAVTPSLALQPPHPQSDRRRLRSQLSLDEVRGRWAQPTLQ